MADKVRTGSEIPPIDTWDAETRYLYEERAGIKIDSGIPVEEAERQAMEEVWRKR